MTLFAFLVLFTAGLLVLDAAVDLSGRLRDRARAARNAPAPRPVPVTRLALPAPTTPTPTSPAPEPPAWMRTGPNTWGTPT